MKGAGLEAGRVEGRQVEGAVLIWPLPLLRAGHANRPGLIQGTND